MVTIPRLDAAASPGDVAAALDESGCCVVEGLVDAGVMDAVATEMAPHVGATAFGTDDFAGAGTRRTGMLLDRSPTFREHLVRHPAAA